MLMHETTTVYVFEYFHRSNLEQLFPDASSKVKLLGSVIDGVEREIPDPVSGSEEGIVQCYKEIQKACQALVAPGANLRVTD